MVWPVSKLRLEAVGRGVPVGQTVRNEAVVGLVAVTLMATESTPVAGTPPRPVTTISHVSSATRAPVAWNRWSEVG